MPLSLPAEFPGALVPPSIIPSLVPPFPAAEEVVAAAVSSEAPLIAPPPAIPGAIVADDGRVRITVSSAARSSAKSLSILFFDLYIIFKIILSV